MAVRGLSSRGTKTEWASKGEKIMGAKTWGGQQPAESGIDKNNLGYRIAGARFTFKGLKCGQLKYETTYVA